MPLAHETLADEGADADSLDEDAGISVGVLNVTLTVNVAVVDLDGLGHRRPVCGDAEPIAADSVNDASPAQWGGVDRLRIIDREELSV